MHGHHNPEEFFNGIAGLLGSYYLILALMNAVAALYVWKSGKARPCFRLPLVGVAITTTHVWITIALFFSILAPIAMSGSPGMIKLISYPQVVRDGINNLMGPMVYSVGIMVFLWVLYVGRKFFTNPTVAWSCLNLILLAMGLAITDPNFASIITKADNVPIVGLVYLLGFFTWVGMRQAVINDERMSQGLEPLEKINNEKVLVWPDLVYSELICMIAITALLLVWAILLKAPLEEAASTVKTPNPSKAPWYFLGLQEMLVYFDPWMAGVVMPSLVVFGLMAIPYLDFNKQGNAYYTIDQRKFAYLTFLFGFLGLWVMLIVLGTFMRGPNWNFFGPFETWDPHKVQVLNNVDVSEYFWNNLGNGRPAAASGATEATKIGYILLRELPGILLVIAYFSVIPPAMVVFSKFFRTLFLRMGFVRFMLMTNLMLMMALLPIKMVLRWSFNLKYIIAIPEYLINL